MKINYELIRNILEVMEEYNMHEILGEELLKRLDIKEPKDDNSFIIYDNLIGHIKLLFDNDCISTTSQKDKYGFVNMAMYTTIYGPYRITAKGYDFLSALREDKIFSKIKDFSINVAIEAAKQLLVKLASGDL